MDLPKALKEAQGWVGEKKGVISVGQGKESEEDCITVVILDQALITDPALVGQIPEFLYGVKIIIEISERFSAQGD